MLRQALADPPAQVRRTPRIRHNRAPDRWMFDAIVLLARCLGTIFSRPVVCGGQKRRNRGQIVADEGKDCAMYDDPPQ
jgi:hypothetical protein